MGFFKRLGGNVVSENSHLGDTPKIEELIGSVKVMLDAFDEGKIDRLYLANNVFVNTMTQKPTVDQLLPVAGDDSDEQIDSSLGLHLRAGCQGSHGWPADALHRVAGLPGPGGKHRL